MCTSAFSRYSDVETAQQLYKNMAADEQKDKITEGKAPPQVALDRSAYLMDLAMFDQVVIFRKEYLLKIDFEAGNIISVLPIF